MIKISDKRFKDIVSWAIDSMPREYTDNIKNLAIVVEDEPSPEQRTKLHLVDGVLLFGLYEGVPLTSRGGNYNLVLPDKITIFKKPLAENSYNINDLRQQVRRTVWHEIAHHFGLDHKRIHELENKNRKDN